MDEHLKNLLEDVLRMPPEQRAFIADRIMDSLDDTSDIDIEMTWQTEIQKRVESNTPFLLWDDVRKTL